jgi:hypothetical protein
MKTRTFGSLKEGDVFEIDSFSRGEIIKIKTLRLKFGSEKKIYNAISKSGYAFFFQDNRKVRVI